MNELTALQHELASYLRTGDAAIERQIGATARVSATTRLGVYFEAYRLRLQEALGVDYPGLAAVLGRDEFKRMAQAYIERHPSEHYSLRYFGQHVPQFLASHSGYSSQSHLAELASFEWALRTAFDAEDHTTVATSEVSVIAPGAWPSMGIIWQSAFQRLDLHWNVAPRWQAVNEGIALPALQHDAVAVPWLLWRQDLKVYFRSLDAEEAYAIDAVTAGADFAGICDVLSHRLPEADVPFKAAGYLRAWLDAGLVRQLVLPVSAIKD